MIKFPCKNCKDRTVEPNCHTTCERYLGTKKVNDKLLHEKHLQADLEYLVNFARVKKD